MGSALDRLLGIVAVSDQENPGRFRWSGHTNNGGGTSCSARARDSRDSYRSGNSGD